MKKIILTPLVATILLIPIWVWSNSKHSDKEERTEHGQHGEHDREEGHEYGEQEQSSSVGPEKGILDASESNGIKLSPEALKNFEIKTQKLTGNGPWTLPISARFQSGEETNLFRLRNGFFKRVDFTQVKRDAQQFVASSKELKDGDEIVVDGVGYLRIAEVTAFGGGAEGHSH